MSEKTVVVGKNTIDVSRVMSVTRNAVEGGTPTYTLRYDGAHDDTDIMGNALAAGKVGDYSKDMPKDARANVGNRQTFTEEELSASGFFDVYNELHKGANVGPQKKQNMNERQPASE